MPIEDGKKIEKTIIQLQNANENPFGNRKANERLKTVRKI